MPLLLYELNHVSLYAAGAGVGSGFLLLNRRPQPGHSQLQRTFYQLLIGACCVLPFLSGMALPTSDSLLWIALAGIFPGFLAIYCAIVALQHLSTRVYATLAYLEPVTVILAGWLLFAEQLSVLQGTGVLLIMLTGLMLALRHKPTKVVAQALTKVEQQLTPLAVNADTVKVAEDAELEKT